MKTGAQTESLDMACMKLFQQKDHKEKYVRKWVVERPARLG